MKEKVTGTPSLCLCKLFFFDTGIHSIEGNKRSQKGNKKTKKGELQ